MLVEKKYDYSGLHSGHYWAKEVNACTEEIEATHVAFFPARDENRQMVVGINLMNMSNIWNFSQSPFGLTLLRREGLPIAEYYDGLSGHVLVTFTNSEDVTNCRFLTRDFIPIRLRGMKIETGMLIENVIYIFIVREDEVGGFYFDLFPISLDGGTMISSSSGRRVTSRPLMISDGYFTLDDTPNGDLDYNECRAFTVVDGLMTNQYDTKQVTVDPNNPKRFYVDMTDGINVDGRFAIVVYTL